MSRRWLPIAVLALAGAACQADADGSTPAVDPPADELTRLPGDSISFGDGVVRTWAEVDAAGRPLAVLFDWAPEGHPPADLYAAAHWDAHFYTIGPAERRRIGQGESSERPPADHMPDGFITVPRLGLLSFPEMGVHWVHEDAGELTGSAFDQTLIYGSTGDRTIFVEPMFTAAFLAERRDVDLGIPQPAAVGEAGFYPTRYVIRRDPDDASVRIALEEFRWREGES